MTNDIKKTVITVLILTILGLFYYNYANNKKHQKTETILKEEKNELIGNLEKMENQYNDAISKNTMLSEELTNQKNSITSFKDSLKKLKKTNWKLIKFYKNKIEGLNSISNRLLHLNDSIVKRNNLLNSENQTLYEEKQQLTTSLDQQTTFNDTLVKQNLDLAKKVTLGKVIKANSFAVSTYREKSNGQYKVSSRARRVDLFKTSFLIVENQLAQEQDLIAHIIITDPYGKLVIQKGQFTTKDGEELKYSETSTIPFKKASIVSDILIKTDNVKLEKGSYNVDFYLQNMKIGSTEIVLN